MLSDNSIKILERDYLLRDAAGNICELPSELFDRIAHSVALIDKKYGVNDCSCTEREFKQVMNDFDFLPNSPTLKNAGKPKGQLSACFVLPIEDSIESIYEAISEAAIIQKSGGGTGFSFSNLRPKNDSISINQGTSSGPVSFMQVFDASTNAIKQGGIRRGANIAILNVNHPDIEEFIFCKNDNSSLSNFNISVGITDDFIKAVKEDKPYKLINPRDKQIVREVSAIKLFNDIATSAYEYGEPGVLFWNTINQDNQMKDNELISATNPCGEQPLLAYESCNLGSINLSNMCEIIEGNEYRFNKEKLKKTVSIAVHFLDNVIDANTYPLTKIEAKTKQTRKIGLGVMGWADALIKLKMAYDSQKARDLASEIMCLIQTEAEKKSEQLAVERGKFPLASSFGATRRNATLTTIAPTGTLSLIAGCSSGIEPIYALAYTKRLDDGSIMKIISAEIRSALEQNQLYSSELEKQIILNGSLSQIDEIPESLKKVLITSHEISFMDHIKMQAAFQTHTDNAVSKTINMPNSASIEDVKNAFMLAHELGCKGVTIFRDGCKRSQILNTGINMDEKNAFGLIKPKARPDKLSGETHKLPTGCGTLYVTVNRTSDGIVEVFTNTGKGGCHSQSEAIARLISVALRSGISVETITSQLDEVKCISALKATHGKIKSCPHAISKAMCDNEIYSEMKVTLCSCGAELVYENGCFTCKNCGKSNCQ